MDNGTGVAPDFSPAPTGPVSRVKVNPSGDFLLALWFLFVAFAFWSPYPGMGVSAFLTGPVYALVLMIALVYLGLRVARERGKDGNS